MFAAWADQKGFDDFLKKDSEYQALIVSAYRVKNQMDAVLSEDARIKAEQERLKSEAQRNAQMWR